MFLPLHDGVALRNLRAAFVTIGMIGLCTVLFAAGASGALGLSDAMVATGFGMIPALLFGTAILPEGLPHVPAILTPVTNIFLHASLVHLVGNMLFLWVFGDNVEDAMGHWRYGLFLVICGICGSLAHAAMNPGSEQPLIGASGAVSGVIVAYLMLHPHVRVLGLVLKAVPLRIPALWALGGWMALQFFQAFAGLDASVGWWAHIGGLLAGLATLPLLMRPGTRLLGRGIPVIQGDVQRD